MSQTLLSAHLIWKVLGKLNNSGGVHFTESKTLSPFSLLQLCWADGRKHFLLLLLYLRVFAFTHELNGHRKAYCGPTSATMQFCYQVFMKHLSSEICLIRYSRILSRYPLRCTSGSARSFSPNALSEVQNKWNIETFVHRAILWNK